MYGTLLLIGTDDQAFSQFLKYFESTLRFEIRFYQWRQISVPKFVFLRRILS